MEECNDAIGSIAALWRYPIKSMQGEEIAGGIVTERGLLGDRAYALIDRVTGHVASAKYPRKWEKLLLCRAVYTQPPRIAQPLPAVEITLPDGHLLRSDNPEVDAVLSDYLGREVTLAQTAPGAPTREADRTPLDGTTPVINEEPMSLAAPRDSFFDYAPLHLLTDTSLQRLQDTYPEGRFVPQRFRPNILITSENIESGWLGHTLRFGDTVRLSAIDPCPRCVITTLPQGELPKDIGILRTIARTDPVASVTLAPGIPFPAVLGIYATIHAGGTIHRSDPIHLER